MGCLPSVLCAVSCGVLTSGNVNRVCVRIGQGHRQDFESRGLTVCEMCVCIIF